jgi:hypothetical protein
MGLRPLFFVHDASSVRRPARPGADPIQPVGGSAYRVELGCDMLIELLSTISIPHGFSMEGLLRDGVTFLFVDSWTATCAVCSAIVVAKRQTASQPHKLGRFSAGSSEAIAPLRNGELLVGRFWL